MKCRSYVLAMVIGMGIASCENKKTVVTKSGISVDFMVKGDSSGYNENDIVLLNLFYVHQDGDTMFNTAQNGMPLPLRYNKETWDADGVFYEVVGLCGKGDSLTFSISAYQLFIGTFKSPVPDSIEGNDMLHFTMGIEDIMTTEEFMALRTAKNLQFEATVIDQYLTENNLTAERTESGLTYIITQQGEGENAVAGDEVVVHYTGSFLDNRVFDSSVGREPFTFVLGRGGVIKGWDEGIALLNPGSKATYIIPSALGYGERGAQGAIPPNTILKFDVELLEIKK